jgi:hypothetical protein
MFFPARPVYKSKNHPPMVGSSGLSKKMLAGNAWAVFCALSGRLQKLDAKAHGLPRPACSKYRHSRCMACSPALSKKSTRGGRCLSFLGLSKNRSITCIWLVRSVGSKYVSQKLHELHTMTSWRFQTPRTANSWLPRSGSFKVLERIHMRRSFGLFKILFSLTHGVPCPPRSKSFVQEIYGKLVCALVLRLRSTSRF